jgi:hypothetical protein
MDYEKCYNNLILTRKDRIKEKDVYYENHHIIPECIGGDSSEDNMVYLTAREHYLAHWLLYRIHKINNSEHLGKLSYAFFVMGIGKHNKKITSSRSFAEASEAMSKATSERNLKRVYKKYKKRKPVSDEFRKSVSERMKGVPKSEEHKKKMALRATGNKYNPTGINGIGFSGRTHTEESKKLISENHADMSGEKNPFYGKTHTEETRKKISEAGKKRVCSEETRRKMSESRKGKKHKPHKEHKTYGKRK